MHIISRKPFEIAANKHAKNATAILQIYSLLKKAECKSPEELKSIFGTLDRFKYKEKWYVIDIAGNNLRMLAFIEFRVQKIFVKHIVTHADYDKLCKRYAKG